MDTNRLLHLIEIMKNVRDSKKPFDLANYLTDYSVAKSWGDTSGLTGNLDLTCGTTCCAMGYAALDPTFQQQGLKLFIYEKTYRIDIPTIEAFNHHTRMTADFHRSDAVCIPVFREREGDTGDIALAAATDFFDISKQQALYCFYPDSYFYSEADTITPDRVIQHIEQIIDGTWQEPTG